METKQAPVEVKPRIHISQFEQYLHEQFKGGRRELIGAFLHYVEHVKKNTHDTEENFKKFFEEFKSMKF